MDRGRFSHRGGSRRGGSRGGRGGRFNHRRGGRGNSRHSQNSVQEFDSPSGSQQPGERHPSHLRGRDIGLFYARQNSTKNKLAEARPLGHVLLSESKKQHITDLLGKSTEQLKQTPPMKDSQFLQEFYSNIQGSIDDKLHTSIELERNSVVDDRLKLELSEKVAENVKYRSLLEKRRKLPAYGMRESILRIISGNQVVVISGETGCGKTTQVTQFILDDFIERGNGSLCNIVCTQPRRISAVSVSQRVSDERGESLGISCGYQIRLEKKLPRSRGSITYCTTGVLLRQMASDPLLRNITHLILDEIHERDIMSDFTIALMKKVLPQRRDLKLVLMSATLNADKFSRYYSNCPVISIPGFTYAVKEYYLEDVIEMTRFKFEMEQYRRKQSQTERNYIDMIGPHIRLLESENKYSQFTTRELWNPKTEEINLDLILELILHICTNERDNGGILVFLTGFAEISNLVKMLNAHRAFSPSQYIIFGLHSQMGTSEQQSIFAETSRRKIIIATNIAETSITIDDVTYVINCGRVKVTGFQASGNQDTLAPEFVSLASANQRRGRAGRVKEGVCYHLLTTARFMILDRFQLPEILRTRLENVILQVKALQLGKAKAFLSTLLDPPEENSIDVAVNLLTRLEALNEEEILTPLGYHLSKLPMSPQIGKMLIFGVIFRCLNPILSIAASLDFKDPFLLPLGKEAQADEARYHLSQRTPAGVKSDHILLHVAMDGYHSTSNKRGFCNEFFLSEQTLRMLDKMRGQYVQQLGDMGWFGMKGSGGGGGRVPREYNVNGGNLSLVKAVVAAGLFPNVAIVKRFGRNRHSQRITLEAPDTRIKLHKKSLLARADSFESPLLVYHKRLKTDSDCLHDASMVYPLPLIFFGDRFRKTLVAAGASGIAVHCITVSDMLRFKCSESTSQVVGELRGYLSGYLQRRIEDSEETGADQGLLDAIIELITNEDIEDMDLEAYDDE